MVKHNVAKKATGVLNALAELAWPTRCIGCNLPGELLCESCRAQLPWICQRWACPVCGAPFGWLACTECDCTTQSKSWPTRSVVCSFPFQGVAALLPPILKDAHELRLAPVMAAAIACSLEEASAWEAEDGTPRYRSHTVDALCFVPATSEAYARRGFDHMELVCRYLSLLLDVPLADVLVRHSSRDQRELNRFERMGNLQASMQVVGDIAGKNLLLVDDVVTTGASLCEAAYTLLEAKAASVSACAFARVWQG